MPVQNQIEEIRRYFSTPRISSSLLSALQNPKYLWLKERGLVEDEEKVFFKIGSALDCLLTSPDRWDTDFMVATANRPTGLLGKFVSVLPLGLTRESPVEEYLGAYEYAGYRRPIEWVIEFFWTTEDAVKFYEELQKTDDNTIVLGKDEFDLVIKMRDSILGNPFTAQYFVPTNPNIEILTQVPIYFEYANHECKALLDGVLMDHLNKQIIPYDLKTTGKSVFSFPESYLQFGYYRQCAFYEAALLSNASPVKDLLDDGYRLCDYLFIVVETKKESTNPAVIYKTNAFDRLTGLVGGYIKNRYYKGVNGLIQDYMWHKENDYWEMPRQLYEDGGVVELSVFDQTA